jgi:hypothetical protein
MSMKNLVGGLLEENIDREVKWMYAEPSGVLLLLR